MEIYPYKTNIHVLTGELFDGDHIDENIDLLQHLISRENDPDEKKKLRSRFTDIFLVFDMDIQDKRADIIKLEAMLRFFDDPADNGKLYINYPMLESYRHLRSLDDEAFKDRCVAVPQLCEYKKIVGMECCNELKDVNRYEKETFRKIIILHLKKANFLLNGEFELPSFEEFESWEGADILRMQHNKIKKDNSVFVLNTSLFNVVDYRPSDFLIKQETNKGSM
ncbi:MAG: hypothetical protein LBP82_03040 [Candidatus Methanoplasma sp.]|nr:hypothetical protein [Candidatus Methanoplasma sp.]